MYFSKVGPSLKEFFPENGFVENPCRDVLFFDGYAGKGFVVLQGDQIKTRLFG